MHIQFLDNRQFGLVFVANQIHCLGNSITQVKDFQNLYLFMDGGAENQMIFKEELKIASTLEHGAYFNGMIHLVKILDLPYVRWI